MEEGERPRKIQKLGNDESNETEPFMTGAIGDAQNGAPEQSDAHDEKDTPAPTIEERESGSNDTPTQAAAEGTDGIPGTPAAMSKRQLRKQLRREQWEADREQRKAKRKEKNAARRERKRAAWEEAKQQGKDTPEELRKIFPVQNRRRHSTRVPITLVIDCGFDDLMLEKERVSLSQQLTRSYSENHKSPFSTHFVVSSFNKLLKERFETVLNRTHEHWRGVQFMEEDWLHAAKQAAGWMQGPQGGDMVGALAGKTDAKPEDGEIVYLSSDSSETLTELKPYSTYIIGGLVDKNRHKGICHKRATEMGIKTAKLPIGDYIQMASRSVLATNHVVEIMVRWLQLGDWGEAFMKTIPPRKGGVLKSAAHEPRESASQQDNADDNAESSGEQEAAADTTESAKVEDDDPGEHHSQKE